MDLLRDHPRPCYVKSARAFLLSEGAALRLDDERFRAAYLDRIPSVGDLLHCTALGIIFVVDAVEYRPLTAGCIALLAPPQARAKIIASLSPAEAPKEWPDLVTLKRSELRTVRQMLGAALSASRELTRQAGAALSD